MKKYFFLQLLITDRGREYYISSVHFVPSVRYSIEKAAKDVAKRWYEDGEYEELPDGVIDFIYRGVQVSVYKAYEISEAEYEFLDSFI